MRIPVGCGLTAVVLAAAVLPWLEAWAEPATQKAPSTTISAQATPGVTAPYVPPDRGAPEARVSGGTRGLGNDLRIDVLTPEQIGLTLQAQPTLFWYNSQPIVTGVRVSIVDDHSNETVLNAAVPGPIPAGIHGFSLKATTVRLALNADYQWSVTAAVAMHNQSLNVVASGMIRRIVPVSTMRGISGNWPDAGSAYARLGVWYDALDAFSQAIRTAPQNRELHLRRGALLEQVGLKEAAVSDGWNATP